MQAAKHMNTPYSPTAKFAPMMLLPSSGSNATCVDVMEGLLVIACLISPQE